VNVWRKRFNILDRFRKNKTKNKIELDGEKIKFDKHGQLHYYLSGVLPCQFHTLIKSGGGTGPMKPGNRARKRQRCQFQQG